MKESVGDEFTLIYSEETKSTSIEKGYFQNYDSKTGTPVAAGERSAF
jgi:hypothetical protein